MTAPVVSLTTPEIVLWARAGDSNTSRTIRQTKTRTTKLIVVISPFPFDPDSSSAQATFRFTDSRFDNANSYARRRGLSMTNDSGAGPPQSLLTFPSSQRRGGRDIK